MGVRHPDHGTNEHQTITKHFINHQEYMPHLCIIEDSNEDRITLFVTYPDYWEDKHISAAFEMLISKLPGYDRMERINERDTRFFFKQMKDPIDYLVRLHQRNLTYYVNETMRSYDLLYRNLRIINNN